MNLHFGETQAVVGIVYVVLVAGLVAIFAVAALRAGTDVPLTRVQAVGYWIRRRWLGVLAALLVVVVGVALLTAPYPGGSASGRTPVSVTGGQFYWSIRPATVRVGMPARFEVTAADVNHGFGIYDPDGRMVGSVQAMPGYTNHLDLTFDRPGRYEVVCLEFCGVDHHRMKSSFTVVRG